MKFFILFLALWPLLFSACSDDTSAQSSSVDAVDASDLCEDGQGPGCSESIDLVENSSDLQDDQESFTIDPACDRDRDGAISIECGGNDCNDNSRRVNPLGPEFCDDIDNNCDGNNNEGIECFFYAHTADALYEVNPFELTATKVADLPQFNGLDINDIDTHPTGDLYGITIEGLYLYSISANQWFPITTFDHAISYATGMAFDASGVAFITAENNLYSIDLANKESKVVGALGGDYYSSGDCVVNKFNTLYMTSKHLEETDTLIQIDRNTAVPTEIGPIGFRKVYGLTFAFTHLYGLTSSGELIEIDPNTGQGTLLHTFDGLKWYGAASTPGR